MRSSYEYFTETVMKEISDAKEKELMSQLNEIISRGLLVVEQTKMVLVKAVDSDKIEAQFGIRLVPKEFEYIKKLEAENQKLRDTIDAIYNTAKSINLD